MNAHIDDGVLQDLLEGLLDPASEKEIREHLALCSRCRRELEAIRELRDALGELPVEARPPRDLWPQIAWRMEGVRNGPAGSEPASREPEVAEGASVARRPFGWRVSLPAWQLLAASIALIVLSGASVWAVLSGRVDGDSPEPWAPAVVEFASWQEAYGGYDEAVADLEGLLDRGREILDPETVRVLEENLRTIDRAIQEAEEALADDPGSALLQRFLVDHKRRKVELLRQAAGAVLATT